MQKPTQPISHVYATRVSMGHDVMKVMTSLVSVLAMALLITTVTGLLMKHSAVAATSQNDGKRVQSSIERQVAVQGVELSLEDKANLKKALLDGTMALSHPNKHLAPQQTSPSKSVVLAEIGGTLTREQVIQSRQSSLTTKAESPNYSDAIYHEFSIYDASSRLFQDDDYDGFYQTFGVIFDADVYAPIGDDTALVYADLYLSQDGGPWEHYYTTDVFTIQGDSETDDYEVVTTLNAGYLSDHYDVLIDLYEVGYSDIVATISSDETDGLYALPLESTEYDTPYEPVTEEVIIIEETHSGGSISILGLLFASILIAWRRKQS